MSKPLLVALLEVRGYLRDRTALAFSLLLPIAIFALMYGAFGGQSLFHGTAHIVNEDQEGDYSALLLERLEEIDSLDVDLLSASDAGSKLSRSDLLLVLYIPADFSEQLDSGESAQLVFKQRGNGGEEGQIVAGIVAGVAGEIAQELQVLSQVEEALSGTGVPKPRIDTTVQTLLDGERVNPTVAVTEDVVGTSPDPVNLFLPGVITMFVLFGLTIGAAALVQERKRGTLERLLTTHLGVGQLFAGKFLANVSRGFIQTLILLALSYAVFQIFTPLSFVEALVIALIFSATASSIGMIIASVARTEDQAIWIAVFFTMSTAMLGGTFFEISEGTVIDTISMVSINTYANDAFRVLIVEGGSLADAALELAVLVGVAIVGLVISRALFKVVAGGR